MAVFDYGAFFVWGDNEVGQLGNRKRSFMESPFPRRKFEIHHNVENIAAGVDSAAVIVEALPPRKKNPDRKKKRALSLEEINAISDARIKAQNESKMFENQRREKKEEEEAKERVPLDQRFRNKLHSKLYGESGINVLKEDKK